MLAFAHKVSIYSPLPFNDLSLLPLFKSLLYSIDAATIGINVIFFKFFKSIYAFGPTVTPADI